MRHSTMIAATAINATHSSELNAAPAAAVVGGGGSATRLTKSFGTVISTIISQTIALATQEYRSSRTQVEDWNERPMELPLGVLRPIATSMI